MLMIGASPLLNITKTDELLETDGNNTGKESVSFMDLFDENLPDSV